MSNFWSDPSVLFPKQQHRWIISFGDTEVVNGKLQGYQTTGSIIPPHYIKSVERPNYDIGTIEAKFLYTHTINFNKRLVWQPINITLYDVSEPEDYIYAANGIIDDFNAGNNKVQKSTQNILYNILERFGYFSPQEANFNKDKIPAFKSYHFKANIVNTLGIKPVNLEDNKIADKNYMSIHELYAGGDSSKYGTIIETWRLHNPLLIDVKNDKLDYTSDAPLMFNLRLAYDWAELIDEARCQSVVSIPPVEARVAPAPKPENAPVPAETPAPTPAPTAPTAPVAQAPATPASTAFTPPAAPTGSPDTSTIVITTPAAPPAPAAAPITPAGDAPTPDVTQAGTATSKIAAPIPRGTIINPFELPEEEFQDYINSPAGQLASAAGQLASDVDNIKKDLVKTVPNTPKLGSNLGRSDTKNYGVGADSFFNATSSAADIGVEVYGSPTNSTREDLKLDLGNKIATFPKDYKPSEDIVGLLSESRKEEAKFFETPKVVYSTSDESDTANIVNPPTNASSLPTSTRKENIFFQRTNDGQFIYKVRDEQGGERYFIEPKPELEGIKTLAELQPSEVPENVNRPLIDVYNAGKKLVALDKVRTEFFLRGDILKAVEKLDRQKEQEEARLEEESKKYLVPAIIKMFRDYRSYEDKKIVNDVNRYLVEFECSACNRRVDQIKAGEIISHLKQHDTSNVLGRLEDLARRNPDMYRSSMRSRLPQELKDFIDRKLKR